MQNQHLRSAVGAGLNCKLPLPLVELWFLHPWIMEFPVTQGVGAVLASSIVILSLFEHLGFLLPLCVVGMGAEPAPKVCSEY